MESSAGALIIQGAMGGDTIQLDHGTGGEMSHVLFSDLIAPRFAKANKTIATTMTTGVAIVEVDSERVALAANSFMVDPIFFGKGDIGRLAVCGTVNDLAIAGAVPRYLTLSLVIEQGLPIADLARVLDSVRDTAIEAGISVVAGDTRVVPSGEVDKLVLNTAGVGELTYEPDLGVERVQPGDAVIVTGPVGEHGVHLLGLRAGMKLAAKSGSDCAPIDGLVWNVFEDYAGQVRYMHGLARGGLRGALNELADKAGVSIEVDGHRVPLWPATRRAAQRLGVDPLQMPCEGSICMVVAAATAAKVQELIRWQPQGRKALIVGRIRKRGDVAVTKLDPNGRETIAPPDEDSEPSRLR